MEGSMGATCLLLLLLVQTLLQMGKLTLIEGEACLRCHSWSEADLGAEPRLAGSLASAVITMCMFPTAEKAGNRGLKDQLAPVF